MGKIKKKVTRLRYEHYCKRRKKVTTAVKDAKYWLEKKLVEEIKTNSGVFYSYSKNKTSVR